MLKARLYEHELQKREKENLKEFNQKQISVGVIKYAHMFYNPIN